MRKSFFHIGSSKTATTTLQKCIFPNTIRTRYLGKQYKGNIEIKLKPIFNFTNDVYFAEDRLLPERFEEFHKVIQNLETALYGNINENFPLWLSYENFLSIAIKLTKFSNSFYSGNINLAVQ